MPEHWLTFTYQYGIGGTFFTFIVTLAVRAGVLNLKTRNGKTIFSLIVGGALLFMAMHIVWIYSVMYGYVLSADQKYIKYINTGSIKEIAKVFQKKNIILTKESEIKILEKDKIWLIHDKKSQKEYIVKKAENFSEEEYLFSIHSMNKKKLSEGKIPEELQNKFKKQSINILPNFELKPYENPKPPMKQWFLLNDEIRYLITPITTIDVLNVYKLSKYKLNVYLK